MRRGQGSLEYLLILAAILAIAVVVVLVANAMLGSPSDAGIAKTEVAAFAMNGIDVRGYEKPFSTGNPATLPASILADNTVYVYDSGKAPADSKKIGTLTDSSGTKHNVYTGGGGSSNYYVDPRPVNPSVTPVPGQNCSDLAMNQDESDVDCGGTVCTGCVIGWNCTNDWDCLSGNCSASGKCVAKTAAPTCSDGFQNQDESDVDCGGTTCSSKCDNDKNCGVDTDCTSGNCSTSGKCAVKSPVPNCTDLFKNGNETDTDCGGAECRALALTCADGDGCLIKDDCTSGNCSSGVCSAVSSSTVSFSFSGFPLLAWTDPWTGTHTNTTQGSIKLAIDPSTGWIRGYVSNAAGSQWIPYIAIDSNNVVHVSWNDDVRNPFYANSSSAWTPKQVSSLADWDYFVNIAVDSANRVHLVWHNLASGIYYANSSSGWVAKQLSAKGSYPAIGIDSSNVVHVAWENSTGLYYAKSSNGWAVATVTTSSTPQKVHMAVGSNGVIHLVYRKSTGGYDLYYANSSSGWAETKISDASETDATFFGNIDTDSNNVVHAFWGADLDGDMDIYYANSATGWVETKINNDVGKQSYPNAVIDSNNVIHLTWMGSPTGVTNENGGQYSVFYANSATAWAPAKVSATTTEAYPNPQIAVDSSNTPHIVWTSNGDGDWDIYQATKTTSSYYSAGKFVSDVKDTSYSPANFTRVSWTENKPAGTSITVKLFFSNSSDFATNVSITPTNGQTNLNSQNRYVRYSADLSTTDPSKTPTITSFTLDYSRPNANLSYSVTGSNQLSWVAVNESCASTTIKGNNTVSGTAYSNWIEALPACSYKVFGPNITEKSYP